VLTRGNREISVEIQKSLREFRKEFQSYNELNNKVIDIN
jgi:hypothetical protein